MLEKFVACDCNVASSPANNTAWDERIELARSKGMAELADVTVKRWFTEPNHASPNAKTTLQMVADASLDGFVENTGALCNYDLKEHLPNMRTPGLLIAGEGDGKFARGYAEVWDTEYLIQVDTERWTPPDVGKS